MERDDNRDEGSGGEDAQARGASETTSRGDVGEADLLLSDDGEARRRFLKQALIAGGGLAAASNLLIVNPFDGGGLARLFDTHPPAGERLRRLESLAGYPR